jgi:N-acetylmuramoyl-L-alanine amidase
MKHQLAAALIAAVAVAGAAVPGIAAPTPARPAGRDAAPAMYTRALAEERAVRDQASNPTLAQMRRVVAMYEAIVRRHPSSGYCDNALWQAGNVSLLAFERFGDDADRKTAMRLLGQLVKGYPSSKLVPSARDAMSAAPVPSAAPPAPPAQKPAPDPKPAGVTGLKNVQRAVLPDGVRITVELEAEIAYHQEEIENPRRLFFDLKGVKAPANLQDATLKFDDDVVREVRLGRHPQSTTRLAIDLEGVSSYTVYPLYGPYRIVIDLQRASGHRPAALSHASPPAAVVSARAKGPDAPKPFLPPLALDAKAPSAGVAITDVRPPPPPPPPAPLPVVEPRPQRNVAAISGEPAALPSKQALPSSQPPLAPAANSNGKFSISRQLGLSVSRIVIDAGHGGHDPGAHGNGINEAELTLDVALKLQKLLEAQPGFEVVMTRDTDEFIPLQERTAMANREGADLFLSIHANASRNPQARGVETYFLSFAMNPEAEAVAARENAASGQPMHNLPDIVKTIALNNKINESRDFAATVQKSMVKRLNSKTHSVRDLGVKQAPFVVLIGAGMPSVLAEISFLTNKQDGTLLKSQNYRQQIAQALFEAIQNYQQGLTRMNGLSGKKATSQ